MPQAPVTILNGFLGAGKATLMQSLLVQARSMPGVRPGVIVNAMSKLAVDGAIRDTSEVISRRDPRFAAIPAGSISGAQGLEQFVRAVDKVTAQGDATHVLIETSGSSHPWKIAALEDESLNLLPEEREEMRRRLAGMSPEFGDRRCRLTVIGDRDGLADFADAVGDCFCTPAEVAAWRAGEAFDDPWPASTVRLSQR
ncbi:CobW/HypB/UreG, nucleotide-binding domain [Paracoccus pantotrophus]|nr:CobW/HypB/UreG, nucleotide-binding domain [Paracoccus pantotrophus]